MGVTVGELLSRLQDGQSGSFKADHNGAADNRFVEVAYNWDYGTIPSWTNSPSAQDGPWMGSRAKPRIGLDKMAEPDLTYDGPRSDMVDFYPTGSGAALISDRLLEVFERLDPGSLEIRKVVIRTSDGQAPFNMVMPLRLLEAIDSSHCDVNIIAKKLGLQWVQRTKFPNGAVFSRDIEPTTHNFSDLDLRNIWFWSKTMFDEAKIAGVRGVVSRMPGGSASQQIDQI